MSRIRSVHPALATDEEYMALSHAAARILPLLWCQCDDQGIFEWKPLTLKAVLLPAHNDDMAALLGELEARQFVKRVQINGRSYGLVRNFRRFQRPKKPNIVHVLPREYRSYVGLKDDEAEPAPIEVPPVPPQGGTEGGKPPQMEDVGGRRKEEASVADATGDESPPLSLEKAVFDRGKALFGKAFGGQITKLRKAFRDQEILSLYDLAETKSNGTEWIAGVLRQAAKDGPGAYTAAMIDDEYRRMGVEY